jgi:pyrroline-5-carboxylate reductase
LWDPPPANQSATSARGNNVQRIGFLGAGQMATALAQGFVAAGLVEPGNVAAFDPSSAACRNFETAVPGAKIVASNAEVVALSDLAVLAVKPQHMAAAMEQARMQSSGRLFVSIAAGVTISTLAAGLGTDRVIRVMPNTPALVQCGASALACGPGVSSDDAREVLSLFRSVGLAVELEEKMLDAVTGLSGSGPAFAFVVIEALADGGVRMGLSREAALQLAAQTVLGAARMVLEGEHPAVLKDRVASPGGTTIAGLKALEDRGIRGALIAAVEAATERSKELGRG